MELVRNLPQQYRQDPWVLALADAILGVLEDQSRQSLEIRAQLSLETITWAMDYFFRYLLIREIHQVKTLTQMQQLTLKQFAGGRE